MNNNTTVPWFNVTNPYNNQTKILGNFNFAALNFSDSCPHVAELFVGVELGKPGDDNIVAMLRVLVDFFPQQAFNLTVYEVGVQTARILWNPWFPDEPILDDKSRAKIISDCRAEVCHAIALPGDPDLSGIGVLVSYSIEIVVATLLILYMFWLIFAKHMVFKRDYNSDAVEKFKSTPFGAAYIDFMTLFFDTSLAVAFSFAAAGLVVASSNLTFIFFNFTQRTNTMVIFVSLALWSVWGRYCPNRATRRICLGFVALFVAGQNFSSIEGKPSTAQETLFQECCIDFAKDIDNDDFSASMGILMVLTGRVALNVYCEHSPIMRLFATSLFPKFKRPPDNLNANQLPQSSPEQARDQPPPKWIGKISDHQVKMWIDALFSATMLANAWVKYVSFCQFRKLFADPNLGMDQDKWGLGQALAVLPWIPTCLRFFVFWASSTTMFVELYTRKRDGYRDYLRRLMARNFHGRVSTDKENTPLGGEVSDYRNNTVTEQTEAPSLRSPAIQL